MTPIVTGNPSAQAPTQVEGDATWDAIEDLHSTQTHYEPEVKAQGSFDRLCSERPFMPECKVFDV